MRDMWAWLAVGVLGIACGQVPTEAKLAARQQEFRRNHPTSLDRHVLFDLDCPLENVRWFFIDDRTWGARGCARQVRYVQMCRQKLESSEWRDDCRWSRDSAVEPIPYTADPVVPGESI